MKNYIIAMLVATAAAGHEGEDNDKMAVAGPGSMPSVEMECYEFDTKMCDMANMRCARVEPENWDFQSNEKVSKWLEESKMKCGDDVKCSDDKMQEFEYERKRF